MKETIAARAGRSAPGAPSGGRTGGFTLIEALVVVGLLSILAAIAMPSYLSYLKKANRADAKAILMETAQWMERYYTTNMAAGTGYGGAPAAPISAVSPKGAAGSAVKYNLSFVGTPGATYTYQAVPANSQVGETCGTLTITNTGATTPPTAGCW